MKKLTSILLASALALSLAACSGNTSSDSSSSAADTSSSSEAAVDEATSESAATAGELTTVEEGMLIMSTNAAFPPYEMTNDAGEFEGIDVEIAQAIADKLGLELRIDDMDFDSALLAAQNGKSDMVMAGVSVTEDRLVNLDFTDSYATGIQVVIVPEDSDITSVDDLTGKMIGVQRGTTGDLYCSDTVENGGFGAENVTPYDNGLTAVQALMNGQVDCVVIDNAPAQEFVAANPGLKILDTEYVNEDYAIGVKKGNTQMLDAINGALAELKADGTVQSIIDKYITAD
ncbi:transporter substrate-binding domain-containing protein [Subdoligranulum sp. DSM 109015]|uniref:Transporter substrate-binding domain-containing protein n=1 Tax=Gemmiger gallinarum TaxID=2779354 RepID=A0ABR9R5U7_9FIRM|nr:transporter substrate-binding domain-containing protein [Gemmiger gallinarum]MBE5038140.1 transporter substrate-binding domain-containing protein [Gemmiger gallinarum]